MSAREPRPEPPPSCWLRGCLIAAMVGSAALVLVVVLMMLSRMTPQAS